MGYKLRSVRHYKDFYTLGCLLSCTYEKRGLMIGDKLDVARLQSNFDSTDKSAGILYLEYQYFFFNNN